MDLPSLAVILRATLSLNPDERKAAEDSLNQAGVSDGCNRTAGNLLYTVATKFPANALVHRPVLAEYVVSSKIKTQAQLDAAFAFFSSIGPDNFDSSDFEKACGVDFNIEDLVESNNAICTMEFPVCCIISPV